MGRADVSEIPERNPTEIASCGCPYDPEYDAGSFGGWHLPENHLGLLFEGVRGSLHHIAEVLEELERVVTSLDAKRRGSR